MSKNGGPLSGLTDLAGAVIRLADAADRAVFLAEAWSVTFGVVHPEDVGLEAPESAD